MKSFLLAAAFLVTLSSHAQYFYKDILGSRETADLIRTYRDQKISRVVVNSYDANNTRSEDFYVEQRFDAQTLRTLSRSGIAGQSVLTAQADGNGRVIRTRDSSQSVISTTEYQYDPAGQLQALRITSSDPAGAMVQTEEHLWSYQNGKPSSMLRIKNRIDTTYVQFVVDENGNVTEERSTRKGVAAEPFYYYYDNSNRLTDIVRYNTRARRLLPEYMFEYSPANQVIQRITVPANSSDYLIWRYQYDARGLKVREAIYNKQKQLTGKIEYQYQ